MTIGACVGKRTTSEAAHRDDSGGHRSISPGKQTLTEGLAPPSAASQVHASSGSSSGTGEQAGGSTVPHGGITGDGALIGGAIGAVGGAIVGGLVGGVPGAIGGAVAGGVIGAAVGAALTAPRLTKSTVSGPTTQPNGGFSWGARWSIQNADTSTNGWIVQHVVVQQNVTDASSAAVTPGTGTYGGLQTAWYPIWEAWQVRGGQVFVGGSTSPHNADTYGQDPVGPSTKGTTKVIGSADFYPNLTLPTSFTVRNAAPAWSLPVTNSDPALTGGTGALDHNLTATWDGVAGDGTTTATPV